MTQCKVKIGELFQAIEELEDVKFLHDKEFFQKNEIQVKDETGKYRNVPGMITKEDKIRTIDFGNFKIKCAEKHKICFNPKTGECEFAKNMYPGFSLISTNGVENIVVSNIVSDIIETVYDIEIETDKHLYQTSNGVVHHNTHLVRQLAETLGVPLIRFDMSEYQEKHTVAKLVGSPAGYVGYEDGGLLVDAVRKEPHSIVLLDEIEKAHPDIFNIFLQVMDYATLTDNQGRKADFRNVIIIMTSNAGASSIGTKVIGFGSSTRGAEAVTSAVEKAFAPEFRNRLDKVVTFNDLDNSVVRQIVLSEIKEFQTMLDEKKVSLSVSDEAVDWFVTNGYSEEFGARPIARLIDSKIKDALVDIVLFGKLKKGGIALVTLEKGEIKVVGRTRAKKIAIPQLETDVV